MGNHRSQNGEVPQLLEAAHSLLADGGAALAIIQAHIACERAVADLLHESKKTTTLSPQTNLAKFIRGAAKVDIEAQRFWTDYCQSIEKRNAIVHRGETATSSEARKALKSVAAVIHFVETAKSLAAKVVVHDTDSQVGAQFLDALRARMQALGMTQKELARRLKTSPQRVSDTLSGKHSPSLDTVGRFAKAVDCEVELRLASR